MLRKYLPLLLLAAAVASYLLISRHNNGTTFPKAPQTETGTEENRLPDAGAGDFPRSFAHIIYSRHARCRMGCRSITEEEVKEILQKGQVNARKIEKDSRGITYPLEGVSEGHHLRIVFAPKPPDEVEVVTCIDLDHEWPCHCN